MPLEGLGDMMIKLATKRRHTTQGFKKREDLLPIRANSAVLKYMSKVHGHLVGII